MKIYFSAFLFFACLQIFPQAQDYFPQTGYKWTFRNVPLDSLNREIDSLHYYQIDSLASDVFYQGKDASLILTKSGREAFIQELPYLDSVFINVEGNDASLFVSAEYLKTFAALADSLFGDSVSAGWSSFFQSLENWYAVYKFSSPLNTSYQIFRYDTTFTFDSLSLPLRFEYKGKRLADTEISTMLGVYNCKKFLMTTGISYLLTPPWPLPVVPIPILTMNDTVYIAPGIWEIKRISPSSVLDLSYLGYGSYYLPGLKKEAVLELTSVEENFLPESYAALEQNYPNPFNPSTSIEYFLKKSGYISLKVYDLLGNVAADLINERQSSGKYQVQFNSFKYGLSSGVYFYVLRVDNISLFKKMILIK